MPRRTATPPILAIDLGTSSVRTALFDEKLRALAGTSASSSYRVRHSVDHGAVLDPALLLRATHNCLGRTRRLTKSQLPAVAGSAFWHSLLGLDRKGRPLTPIFTWADARGAEDAARLREELDERVIQQQTGCMLRAAFWPAKLRWLRRSQPRLFGRVARWVSPAEWIFEQLFGLKACSHSMASGTGLYDLRRRDWNESLLEICGLTRSQLNPLADEVAVEDLTVYPSIGDGAASNLGSGAVTPGVFAINVGTSAAVRAVSTRKVKLPFGLFRYAVDRERFLIGGAVSNAGNLRAWCLRELRLPKEKQALEKLLCRSGAEDARLTILPFWVSERAPTWPEQLDGAIHGLTQAITAADLLHAATSSVSHRLADILEELGSAIGPPRRIIVSGGILQSHASLQILANALGCNLELSPNQETSLRGAAVHALEMSGCKAPPPQRGKIIRYEKQKAAAARRDRKRQNQLEQLLSRDPAP
ncbi:MAG: gluconokinase [Chthoniobacterales bacterium]|nr:gluconokinase [Chthoniobacterales bacterium]